MRRRTLGRATLAVAATALLSASASAHRALLIGVGAYPKLDRSLALAAPAEDARRLAGALRRAGLPSGDLTLMTDEDGIAPTRAAVLAALAQLARTARPNEQILVYFSGHGTQAPSPGRADEADGLDELYLMADASGWDGRQGRVLGAIEDDELAEALDAIRARGADLWFVADACHAGGVFRGARGRSKTVPPGRLAIPPAASAAFAAPPARAELPGRFAAFYAAGPEGLATERRLPLGAADARPLSQFSYALVRALDAGRLRSLRDLAIAVNAADDTLGGDAPQPMFEGALDMPVLGLAADRPRRWPVTRGTAGLEIGAGIEEGIALDERFRLRDAAGRPAVEARATTVTVGATTLTVDRPLPAGPLEAERIASGDGRNAFLARLPGLANGQAVRGLTVSASLWRPGARRRCPALDPAGPPSAELRPLDLLAPATLGQCDVVITTVRNGGGAIVDLSPFYVDAAGRLVALNFVDGRDVRLAPGEAGQVAVRLLNQDRSGRALPVGSERLVLLALPATGAPRDLRGVADASPYRSSVPTADGAGALVYRWTVAPAQRPSPATIIAAQ